jgi:ACT domain-containing protein
MYQCNEKIIKNKVGLLNLAEKLNNVSRACKVMGFSRDTFYRYKSAVEDGGINALLDKSRRQPNLKNRTDEITEVQHAIDFPANGQLRASN